jgi:hypothetical protein
MAAFNSKDADSLDLIHGSCIRLKSKRLATPHDISGEAFGHAGPLVRRHEHMHVAVIDIGKVGKKIALGC